MVTIKNQKIVKAVNAHEKSQRKISVLAESSMPTLSRLLKGDTDLSLTSIDKIADFLGFETHVSFVRKPEAAAS